MICIYPRFEALPIPISRGDGESHQVPPKGKIRLPLGSLTCEPTPEMFYGRTGPITD